jgi:hypothetical protein
MKSPAKKIITATIFGALFLNAGFSFAKSHEVTFYNQEVQFSENEDSTERRQEFWEKFRESVTPREKDPPREVKPDEIHNEEVDKKEFQ